MNIEGNTTLFHLIDLSQILSFTGDEAFSGENYKRRLMLLGMFGIPSFSGIYLESFKLSKRTKKYLITRPNNYTSKNT